MIPAPLFAVLCLLFAVKYKRTRKYYRYYVQTIVKLTTNGNCKLFVKIINYNMV